MYSSFIEALPERIRSSDDLDFGTKFRRKEKALACRYLELNQLYSKYIALDIDIPGSAYRWDEKGLPPPTIVIVNPVSTNTQYLYELNTPVYYTESSRRAPQKFYEDIDNALTAALGADLCFTGNVIKNPTHKDWRTICHPQCTYDLADFKEYRLTYISHRKKLKLEASDSFKGRNDTLFDSLRHWAYMEVRQHQSQQSFMLVVQQRAQSINYTFVDRQNGILPFKEVQSTARSVGSWTWRHRATIGDRKNRGVMQLSPDMSMKAKQAAGASYAHSQNSAKQSTKEAVFQAAIALKAAGTPVTQTSVAIRAEVSMRTVKNYWKDVDSHIGLYKKVA